MDRLVRVKGEGTVRVPSQAILTFPEGLVGFKSWRSFVLLEYEDDAMVSLLQSVDDSQVCFFVTDPRNVCPDYHYDLSPGERALLQLTKETQPVTLCIMAIQDVPLEVSVNLLGPLVINPHTRLGKQIVLAGSSYPARFVMSKEETPAEVTSC